MDLFNIFRTSSSAETWWDVLKNGFDYIISIIQNLWLLATSAIFSPPPEDSSFFKTMSDVFERLVLYLYTIGCAFRGGAKLCYDAILQYIFENYRAWILLVGHLFVLYLIMVLVTLLILSLYDSLILLWPVRPIQKRKRILLAIAHPADLALYFGPSILKLREHCDLQILCFGSSNSVLKYRFLKMDLYEACEVLGIPAANITLMRNTVMPTDKTLFWDVKATSRLLLEYIEIHSIEEVYTFDIKGIDGNANHCSLFNAAARLSITSELPTYCKVYILETVNCIRNYSGSWDLFISMLPFCHRRFIISYDQANTVRRALAKLYLEKYMARILFSHRYEYINTYRELENDDVYLQFYD